MKKIGLDPEKPTVLYASNGEWTSWDHLYPKDFIDNYGILKKYNLILRPHPTDMGGAPRYGAFKGIPGVYVDDEHLGLSSMFGDKWDQGIPHMEWVAEIIKNSDVVVTFPSTFTLDSFAFDKPVINMFYDIEGKESAVPLHSLYQTVHYNSILEENPVVLAKNGEEVMRWIDCLVENPALFRNERKRIVDKICYKLDGRACERIANVILNTLYAKK